MKFDQVCIEVKAAQLTKCLHEHEVYVRYLEDTIGGFWLMRRSHFHLPPKHEGLRKLFEPAKYLNTNSINYVSHFFYGELETMWGRRWVAACAECMLRLRARYRGSTFVRPARFLRYFCHAYSTNCYDGR